MSGQISTDVFVVGAGGIGCAVGYALRAGGLDVTFVDTDEQKLQWGRSHGVGLDRHPSLPAGFVHFKDWQPPAKAIILLCTKCYSNEAVLGRLKPSVSVMPIQNGFDQNVIERSAVVGVASFISECLPQKTHTQITRGGSLHIGHRSAEEEAPVSADLEALIRLLEQHGSFRVKRVPNILPLKYTKLMYNAAISPVAAVSGVDNSQLLTHPKARKLFFALLSENYRILKEANVPLGKIGPFHPGVVDRILGLPLVATAMAWPFSLTLRRTYCSMSGDLPKGRTEIDFYNGYLIKLAGQRACPVNQSAYALVKRMEQEGHMPALRWLDELASQGGTA